MNRTEKHFRVLLLACIGIATGSAMHAGAEAPAPITSSAAEDAQSGINGLQGVGYAVLTAGRIVVKFRFRNEVKERPPVIVGYHPTANIVLDFADTVSELPKEPLELGHRVARSIRVLTVDNRTRAVISLNRPVSYEITITGREVLLTLEQR